MSPLIKVCGMTEAENIRNVELQGVDMIGFIFYPKSPLLLLSHTHGEAYLLPSYLPEISSPVQMEQHRRDSHQLK